ncbi:hypothetical protein [Pseudobacteroides cellulosolvens]|uniref:PP-loop domain protein n=1 Tax=Pseudobacteroides cellulosolvens ATCC 35603 = DSM 2933 TaxID=398512 RepID=A0A0L6JHK4_9FIRM|nr:hypothetical protein [Pseudobacteroides cellulosolvens]KNY24967.1 hypothetical protein Bccel_0224 [Pseudobacteroides cellulosolvens ATCC 35603 = DSM 2933]
MASLYCKKCIMKSENSGITFNEEGICNICTGNTMSNPVSHYRKAMKDYMEFDINSKKNKGKYFFDCMLMLSGGKDSTYMLYNLITKRKLKTLAFTVNHPFESRNAIGNIQRAVKRLDIEHINYTPKIGPYRKLMKHVFTTNYRETSLNIERAEKIPCIICTQFMQLLSFLVAFKMRIPYILYCADPMQAAAIFTDVEEITNNMIKFCGSELLGELLGDDIEILLNLNKEEFKPKFVLPYVADNNYDIERIISELKELGLYKKNPTETHCSLYSLLSYYSFSNFDNHFYAAEVSSNVRSGNLDREKTIEFMEKYKDILLNIAVKKEISDKEKEYVRETLKSCYPDADTRLEWEYDNILSFRKTAEDLGVEFYEI